MGQTLHEMEFERGIWSAAVDGDIKKVQKFIFKGNNPNLLDSSGYTALHYAARNGHYDVCEALISAVADVNIPTRAGGMTALHRAALKSHIEVIKLLINSGANITLTDNDNQTALHKAAIAQNEIV